MQHYCVDLSDIGDQESLLHAFNEGLIWHAGGDWNTLNLDAFNDYLSWPDTPYQLNIRSWSSCEVLDREHVPSRQSIRSVMHETFQNHPDIVLELD